MNRSVEGEYRGPGRAALAGAAVVSVGLVVLYFATPLMRTINPDEWQQARNTYDLFAGGLLYTDFWDNHGPLLTYLLLPFFGAVEQGHSIIISMRTAMLPLALASAAGTMLLGLCIHGRRPWPVIMSGLLLLCAPPMIAKGTELRCDNGLLMLWALALPALVAGVMRRNMILVFAAGMLTGGGAGFSTKFLFLGVAGGLMILTHQLLSRDRSPRYLLYFGLGSVLSLAMLADWLQSQAILNDYIKLCFADNLERENQIRFDGIEELFKRQPAWTLIWFWSAGAMVRRWWNRTASHAEILVIPPGLFLPMAYFFLHPTHHLQSFLTSLPLLSVFVAGMTVRIRSDGRRDVRRLGAVLLVLLCLVTIGVRGRVHYASQRSLADQIASADALLAITEPGDAVLDGRGLPLFRPKVTYAASLVNHVGDLHESGKRSLKLEDKFASRGVKLIVYDDRVSRLGSRTRAFLRSVTVPLQPVPGVPDLLLAPGGTAATATGTAIIRVKVMGAYWMDTLPSPGGFLDCEGETRLPITLGPGDYTVRVHDAATTVVFATYPVAALEPPPLIETFVLGRLHGSSQSPKARSTLEN